MKQQSFTPLTADACALLSSLATGLAEGQPLPEALRSLADGLHLRSIVARSAGGDVIGVGGEALRAVPEMRALDRDEVLLELPVPGREGAVVATLTVRGCRPSQLPALRAAAAIVGLGLSGRQTAGMSPGELVEDHEHGLEVIADGLHDGPLQSLMVARYAVDAAVRGGDPGMVREAIQQAVVELRHLVWSLRPRGDRGLAAALEQLSTALVKADQLPLDLTLQGDAGGRVAVLAYRLVQAVHAGAGSNQVRVRLDGSTLDVAGAPLAGHQRWARRAAALGCELSTTGDHTRLVLAPQASSALTADVRTTS